MCQCEHEFAQDGKLILWKYDHRWLNDHKYDLTNVGRNKDYLNALVTVLDDDTIFSFEATTNNDQLYIRNQGTDAKKSYSSLQKLGKDLFSCVSNSQAHSKAVCCAMKQWMGNF